MKILFAALFTATCSITQAATLEGELRTWYPITLTFRGPAAAATDSAPNPFLDYRLQVVFTGPHNRLTIVPGYFDGDGQGGSKGNVWRARFAPDNAGLWRYQATMRQSPAIAVDTDGDAGQPVDLPESSGTFTVQPRDPNASGFLKWGRLEYNGTHYLKFKDGPYWLRGGTDEPENFLAYAGFDNTTPSHRYSAHESDWHADDPDWGDGRGHAIIGALNYLADQHVNSIYFLTMNVGGDGKDVWPWLGPIDPKGSERNDNLHFDLAKLRQWEIVFDHAQRRGIFLHFVLNEAEAANKRELDNGELGKERKLYYRELVARFSHHLALEWNLCEEYNLDFDLGPDRVRQFAEYIRAVDPYHHPVTVHSAGDPVKALNFSFGDPRFSLTSIQLNQRPIHEVAEAMRTATARAGRPLPVSLDEFTLDRGQKASHIPVDDAEGHRREKIWPAYFSGGMLEFILQDLIRTDSFKTPEREKLWRYLWYARHFMEENLLFWEMEPADSLAQGGTTIAVGIGKGTTVPLGPQVLAKRGEVYAGYLPTCTNTGSIDLTDVKGPAEQRWYNPRTGEFVGMPIAIGSPAAKGEPASTGRRLQPIGPPPSDPAADWVVLIRRTGKPAGPPISIAGFLDSRQHWRTIRDATRFIQPLPDQATYTPGQVEEIVGNILLFQRANGGWPKDYDYLAVLTPEQIAAVRVTHDRTDTSFDNHNTHSQVDYLARAHSAHGNEEWRAACLRGFDFMLAAQLANGGFPQRYPNPKSYSAHITFNDGVMIGILNVLKDAADGAPQWKWLDAERRDRARQAIGRAVECILNCQIKTPTGRTGWCQQHDEKTFEAASARTFELASCCPQDTTEIVRFLMRLDSPDERVVKAVDDAVAWLRKVQLGGIRVQRVPAKVETFERHTADFDTIVVADPNAPPLWARHYEIGTDRPIFASRDGIKRYTFAEIDRERRTGTLWYGNWPLPLIQTEYPRWREKQQAANRTQAK